MQILSSSFVVDQSSCVSCFVVAQGGKRRGTADCSTAQVEVQNPLNGATAKPEQIVNKSKPLSIDSRCGKCISKWIKVLVCNKISEVLRAK